MMKRVYTASKLRHAEMWRALNDSVSGVFFHARWLKHTKMGAPDEAEHAVEFWKEDIEDVKTADVVLIYASDDDVLRGALVEAGAAIALGIPVVLAGDNESFGTWQYHPGVVYRTPMLHEAIDFIKNGGLGE